MRARLGAVVVSLALVLAAGTPSAAGAQGSTTSTSTTTANEGPIEDLPLEEVPTSAPEATTPTVPSTTAPRQSDGDGGSDGLSTGTTVILVVAGLLVVALLLSVLTWRYWRATAPPRRSPSTL